MLTHFAGNAEAGRRRSAIEAAGQSKRMGSSEQPGWPIGRPSDKKAALEDSSHRITAGESGAASHVGMLVCVAAAWRDTASERRWSIEPVCEVKYCMEEPVIVSIVISFRYAAWDDNNPIDTVRDQSRRRHSQPWASLRQRGFLHWKAYDCFLSFGCWVGRHLSLVRLRGDLVDPDAMVVWGQGSSITSRAMNRRKGLSSLLPPVSTIRREGERLTTYCPGVMESVPGNLGYSHGSSTLYFSAIGWRRAAH